MATYGKITSGEPQKDMYKRRYRAAGKQIPLGLPPSSE